MKTSYEKYKKKQGIASFLFIQDVKNKLILHSTR
jgi:hypothetical protein